MQTTQIIPSNKFLFQLPDVTHNAEQAACIQDVFASMRPAASATPQFQSILPVLGDRLLEDISRRTLWDIFVSSQISLLDPTKFKNLDALAQEGDTIAQYILEICHYLIQSDEQRIIILADVAARGNAVAQFILGFHYAKGRGAPKNPIRAASLCKKAARQGLSEAQFNLGICLIKGKGLRKNSKEAAIWFKRAAKQGIVKAQFYTGIGYYYGEVVKPDKAKAFKWFERASKQNHAESQYYLSRCYFLGEGIETNKKMGARFCKKAAQQGHSIAQATLSICYATGDGVQRNREKSTFWHRKLAGEKQHIASKILQFLGATIPDSDIDSEFRRSDFVHQ